MRYTIELLATRSTWIKSSNNRETLTNILVISFLFFDISSPKICIADIYSCTLPSGNVVCQEGPCPTSSKQRIIDDTNARERQKEAELETMRLELAKKFKEEEQAAHEASLAKEEEFRKHRSSQEAATNRPYGYSTKNSKAYDELRNRGYSPNEAEKAAPHVTRICKAFGGKDCEENITALETSRRFL